MPALSETQRVLPWGLTAAMARNGSTVRALPSGPWKVLPTTTGPVIEVANDEIDDTIARRGESPGEAAFRTELGKRPMTRNGRRQLVKQNLMVRRPIRDLAARRFLRSRRPPSGCTRAR